MIPQYVVVDTSDGMVFWQPHIDTFFTKTSAVAFATQRNGELREGVPGYVVCKLEVVG